MNWTDLLSGFLNFRLETMVASDIANWPDLDEKALAFLQGYLETLPAERIAYLKTRPILADHFCADEENANICASLVLEGEKRASCGLGRLYDMGTIDPIEVGDLFIVLSWSREPVCIVEQTGVKRLPFGDIDATFAFEEGEGDKSYEWWRKVHWDYFARELAELGKEMHDREEIVTEHFKKVWPL